MDPKETFVKDFSLLENVHSKEFVCIKNIWLELYPLFSQLQRNEARGWSLF